VTIGVFDSGVGGLTVLHALHEALPGVSTAYLGDTARVPYGTRSAETVVKYALNAAQFLTRNESLSVLVVACNTASAVALDALSEAIDVPVVGVIGPTAERALSLSVNQVIGVIGTSGTIQSRAYEKELKARSPSVRCIAKACPLFVPLAEEGWTDPDDPLVCQIIERYLQELVDADIDTLILGCTHYPLLAAVLKKVLPGHIKLADAAFAVAQEVASHAPELAKETPLRRYYVTDVPKGFVAVAERFLGGPIETPIEVDL
jgi:glutamate racemase